MTNCHTVWKYAARYAANCPVFGAYQLAVNRLVNSENACFGFGIQLGGIHSVSSECTDFENNPMKRCFWCEPAREPCQCELHFSGSGSD